MTSEVDGIPDQGYERGVDGLPKLDEFNEEVIQHTQQEVAICYSSEYPEMLTKGTLYITTRKVHWLSDTDTSKDFEVPFRSITMHAVSRDSESFPTPCIYMQVEFPSIERESDDEDDITEMRVIPSDSDCIDQIFQVLCDCAALNPDLDCEENGEGEFYFNEDEVVNGTGSDERADILNRFDAMLQIPGEETVEQLIMMDPERFEDEEEAMENSDEAS
mmetsp:Transcript_14254/g.19652  ORF Transcript_14254/g.19652 Transcript_14254/m.19652 type:complete len:218 (+) Transcript_14254:251-904(+)|eukprot:CAMPEP_0196571668 /NCGR_PEP_ID=MMETSP1081-20130531/1816_1 /TAXON_ID=36882 /ORGANISM="Pyramimonas amylifera, Strain CCMP720" /LENGTH=217 /DNA_ID=CAMNT_0041888701 /DNA_START=226 /DNA_END=879 /DNA_ORIENTATION=-